MSSAENVITALRRAMASRDQATTNVRMLELSTILGETGARKAAEAILSGLPPETRAWWQGAQPGGTATLEADAVVALRTLITEKTSALRVRMKVWAKPGTDTLYLVAAAYFDTRGDHMVVYAMRDEETIQLSLTPDEFNALPYRYFNEDGEAPRPEKTRPMDRIGGGPIKPPGKPPGTGN